MIYTLNNNLMIRGRCCRRRGRREDRDLSDFALANGAIECREKRDGRLMVVRQGMRVCNSGKGGVYKGSASSCIGQFSGRDRKTRNRERRDVLAEERERGKKAKKEKESGLEGRRDEDRCVTFISGPWADGRDAGLTENGRGTSQGILRNGG